MSVDDGSLEWFKGNLTRIESGVASESTDPSIHLSNLISWVEWGVRQGHDTVEGERIQHLFGQGLPRVVNAILNRTRYDHGLHVAQNCLLSLAQLLPNVLQRWPDELSEVIKTLFEQKQPFYLKHGFPSPPPAANAGTSTSVATTLPPSSTHVVTEDRAWVKDLEEGNYLDARNIARVWEMVECDSINADRSQLAVTWASGEKEWLNINDSSRVQAFGTRVGCPEFENSSDIPVVEELPCSSVEDAAAAVHSDADSTYKVQEIFDEGNILDNEGRRLWLSSLGAGSLIDVCNKDGVWFEACVMEIAYKECNEKVSSESDVGKGIECQVNDVSVQQEKLVQTGRGVDCDDIPTSTDTQDIVERISQSTDVESESELNESCVSMSDIVVPVLDSDGEEENKNCNRDETNKQDNKKPDEMLLHAAKLSADSESLDPPLLDLDLTLDLESPPPVPPAPNSFPSRPISVYFRVAFIGCLEYSDEWVEAYSGTQCLTYSSEPPEVIRSSARVAPQGDRAQQHRGYHYSRTEMKYCVDLHRLKLQQQMQFHDSTPLASSPCSTLVSPFFAEVVNTFLRAGGEAVILEKVCTEGKLVRWEKVFEKPTENGAFEEGVGNSDSVDDIPCNELDEAKFTGRGYVSALTSKEKAEPSFHIQPVYEPVKVSTLLVLLSAFASTNEVLSLPVLLKCFDPFLAQVCAIVRSLKRERLREVSIGLVDALLSGVEGMAMMLLGHSDEISRFAVGGKVDSLRMIFIENCLRSDYLNKRLGGLKLLTEWADTVEKLVKNPCGLVVNRSQSSSDSTGKTPTEQMLEAKGLGAVSYTVISLSATSPEQLGRWVLDQDLLTPLLHGENAHDSLVQRSKDVMKFLARHGLLNNNFIRKLFQVEIEVLFELIPVVSLSCLGSMIVHISQEPAGITANFCRLLSLIVKRCREALMWGPNVNSGDNGDDSNVDLNLLMNLHSDGLELLWECAEEKSLVDASVSILCMELINDILERGCTPQQAKDGTAGHKTECERNLPLISWPNHWLRCYPIICRAIKALEAHRDLILSLAVLRNFIISFLDHPVVHDAAWMSISCDDQLPSIPPYRPAVTRFLESRFQVMTMVTCAIGALKKDFLAEASSFYLDCTSSSLPSDPRSIPTNLQSQLNALKLGKALHSYYFTLDKAISFICFFQRTSFSTLLCVTDEKSTHLLLEFSAVSDIWEELFVQAVTMQEREIVVNFLPRLISLGRKTDAEHSTVTSSQDFLAYCNPKSVELIFTQLLAPRSALETDNDHCSLPVLKCIEKYYCWLGIQNGYLELTHRPPSTSTSPARNYFTILKPMDEHAEWHVFLDIIMTANDDAVASEAVALLTDFPQRMSNTLQRDGNVERFRALLLSHCMEGLAGISSSSHTRLRRLLMLLFALLDESEMSDTRNRLRRLAHSNAGRRQGAPLLIKVLFSQAVDKEKRSHLISVFSNDTVDDLVSAVCKHVGHQRHDLKIIRGGKEIVTDPNRVSSAGVSGPKLSMRLAQLKIMNREAVQVILRPRTSSSPSSIGPTNHPAKVPRTKSPSPFESSVNEGDRMEDCVDGGNSAEYEVPFNTFPAVVLATREDYFGTLFNILNNSTDEQVCDDVWHLISRLPSSPDILDRWHRDPNMGSQPSAKVTTSRFFELFSFADLDDSNRLCRTAQLLYNLQIIDTIIHPASIDEVDTREKERSVTGIGINNIPEYLDADRNAWVNSFLGSGGAKAVMFALQHCVKCLQIRMQTGSSCGTSAKLLMCATSLVLKMVRAVTLRTALILPPTASNDGVSPTIVKFLTVLQASKGLYSARCDDNPVATPLPHDEMDIPVDLQGGMEETKGEHLENSERMLNDSPCSLETPMSTPSQLGSESASRSNVTTGTSRPPFKRAKLRNNRPGHPECQYYFELLPTNEWGCSMDSFFSDLAAVGSSCSDEEKCGNGDDLSPINTAIVDMGSFIASLSLPLLQKSLTKLLSVLRNFSLCHLFFFDHNESNSCGTNCGISSARATSSDRMSQVVENQVSLVETANNILLSLGAVLTVSPDLSRGFFKTSSACDSEVDVELLLLELLTGPVASSVVLNVDVSFTSPATSSNLIKKVMVESPSFPGDTASTYGLSGNTSQSMKRGYLAAVVGQWGCEALRALLYLFQVLDQDEEMKGCGGARHFLEIRNSFMVLSLKVRSSICGERTVEQRPLSDHKVSIKPLISFCICILNSSVTDTIDYPQVFSVAELTVICEAFFRELVVISEKSGLSKRVTDVQGSNVRDMIPLVSGKRNLSDNASDMSPAYIGETLQLLAAFSNAVFCHKDQDLQRGDIKNFGLDGREICEFVLQVCLGLVPRSHITLLTLCQHDACTVSSSTNNLLVPEIQEAYNLLKCFGAGSEACPRHHIDWLLDTITRTNISVGSAVERLDWSFNPTRDVRSMYVGLKNLGATCYMNSFMQVLFMNPIVRRQVLACPSVSDNKGMEQLDKSENLVYQLQEMFCALKHSTRRAHDSRGWAHAFKDSSGLAPVNVMVQQDAQEFLGTLFHRLEEQLFLTAPSQEEVKKIPLLQHCFGGTLCNQIVREAGGSPCGVTSADDIRENTEPFVCISLEVKGCSNLESSLSKFVSGESFPDYSWSPDEPRVTITKRQCLLNDQLPQSIIFHLKRFEFNLDTFLREKVNDEFSFPVDSPLDIYPYTKEGLMGENPHDDKKDACFYTLGAIVVHTGTADGGHYFSYVKESYEDVVSRLSANRDVEGRQSTPLNLQEVEKNRRWIEFNDTEVSLFTATRIPAECFGGQTVSHDYDMHSHTVETSTIANPKSAYMLVYYRQCPDEITLLLSKENPIHLSEVSTVEASLVEPILRDNQQHTLVRRLFCGHHLSHTLEFMKTALSQSFSILRANAERTTSTDETSVAAYHDAESNFAKQLCQCIHFVLLYLSKSSSNHAELFSAGVDYILQQLCALSDMGSVLCEEDMGSPIASNFSAADVLMRRTGSKDVAEQDQNQENTPPESHHLPPPPLISTQQSPDQQTFHPENLSTSTNEMTFLESGDLELKKENTKEVEENVDDDDVEDVDDEEMRLALSLSLGEEVDTDKLLSLQSKSPTNVVEVGVEMLAGTSVLATRHVLQLMLRDLYSPTCAPTSSASTGSDNVAEVMRISPLETMLFAPSPEVRHGYAKILCNLYFNAMKIPPSGNVGAGEASHYVKNALGSIAPPLIYHDILSVSTSATVAPPCYVELDLGLLGPSSQSLCVGLVLHLTRNSLFMHAAENWRRCDSYFWLLRQIALSSFEAREVMIQRDVMVQLVDLVIGDLSPACGLLYAKGTRQRPPSSFVSVVPDKTGTVPKHALSTSLPDFTNLFHLLADLVTSTATDPMLTGKGVPPSFSNIGLSGYAGEAVNLNSLQTRQVSFSFCSEESMMSTPFALSQDSHPVNLNEQVLVHETLYSTALKQARYVPALLRIMTHMAFESLSVSTSVAELLVRSVSFASLSETAHVFEVVAAFLKIEDSLATRRAQLLMENEGGLFAVLQDVAFVVKNPTKVCVCLTSLLKILDDVAVARDAVSSPRTKVRSWAVWMLKFCYQYCEKARKEDQLSLALALSASVTDSKSDSESNVVDEAVLLKTSGPYLLVYGENDDERQISWTTRSSSCFSTLQGLLRRLGEEPDALIPMDAFEDYDSNNVRATGAGVAVAATDSILNTNYKRNVTDLTADVVDSSSTDGLTGLEDMPPLITSGGDQQQQGATPDLQNMTDEELALYLSNNQDFL